MAELTALDAAQVVGMNREAIRRWCFQGLIQARRVGLRGDWRIDVDDLRRFTRAHGYAFDEDLAAKLAK